MLLAAGREVVSETSAYNITKLSYRVEVRVIKAFGVWQKINSKGLSIQICVSSRKL